MDAVTRAAKIIGVGASAGGLAALEQLLSGVPEELSSNLAMLVVQHLSPDHDSLMAELLARRTTMKVVQAWNGQIPEGGVVYIAPPGHAMRLRDDHILLEVVDRQRARFPIDTLFVSLSDELAADAAVVVLSGTGTDGAMGVVAVHRMGGLVLAQDPTSATFDGMPRATIATDTVDVVASASSLIRSWIDRAAQRVQTHARRDEGDGVGDHEQLLDEALSVVHADSGIDFRQYRRQTLQRRLERRIRAQNEETSLADYVRLLRSSELEVRALYESLLISSTQFFRDPEAFARLRSLVIEPLVADERKRAGVRVWVAGCGSGEEVYSLGILFLEAQGPNSSADVTIFATDIDAGALERAQTACYSVQALASLDAGLRSKYFVERSDGRFQVCEQLRRLIRFARHDVTSDPPFSQLDLVVCRNLMMHFQPEFEHRAMALIRFALRPGGFLFLGRDEVARTPEVEAYDESARIYKMPTDAAAVAGSGSGWFPKASPRFPSPTSGGGDAGRARPGSAPPSRVNMAGAGAEIRLSDDSTGDEGHRATRPRASQPGVDEAMFEAIVQGNVPACAVVDAEARVIYTYGDVGRLLELRTGRVTTNIIELLDPELSPAVMVAMEEAWSEHKTVVCRDAVCKLGDEQVNLTLRVRPVPRADGGRGSTIIFFEDLCNKSDESTVEIAHDARLNARVSTLERDLQNARKQLRAMEQERDVANEELQTSNEELMSSNEELQSTNEELQSLNEELHTVNAELHDKIHETSTVNDDLNNLFRNIDVGVLFLDLEFSVRKFNPSVRDFVNLVEQDIGRPLAHISNNLEPDHLIEDAERVLTTLSPVEREAWAAGEMVRVRSMPYRSSNFSVTGILITFSDVGLDVPVISETGRARRGAFQAEGVRVAVTDPTLRVVAASPEFLAKAVHSDAEVIGTRLSEFVSVEHGDGSEVDGFGEILQYAAETGSFQGCARVRHPPAGGASIYDLSVQAVCDNRREPMRFVFSLHDSPSADQRRDYGDGSIEEDT